MMCDLVFETESCDGALLRCLCYFVMIFGNCLYDIGQVFCGWLEWLILIVICGNACACVWFYEFGHIVACYISDWQVAGYCFDYSVGAWIGVLCYYIGICCMVYVWRILLGVGAKQVDMIVNIGVCGGSFGGCNGPAVKVACDREGGIQVVGMYCGEVCNGIFEVIGQMSLYFSGQQEVIGLCV